MRDTVAAGVAPAAATATITPGTVIGEPIAAVLSAWEPPIVCPPSRNRTLLLRFASVSSRLVTEGT